MVTEITVAVPVLIAVVARLVETADEGKDGGVDGVAEKYDQALKERLEFISCCPTTTFGQKTTTFCFCF